MRQLPVHDVGAPCTLDEQGTARRNVEFADVVRRGLRHRDRTDDGDVLLAFRRGGGLEDDVRELAVRESACCGFFTFDIHVEDDAIVVRVAAPDDKTDYLDALYQATDPDRTTDGTDTANGHSCSHRRDRRRRTTHGR